MDAVDYDGTSEEDTNEATTRSSSVRKLKSEEASSTKAAQVPSQQQADETINNALDNLASLIPILQSHQKAIESESNENLHNIMEKRHTKQEDVAKTSKHSKTSSSSSSNTKSEEEMSTNHNLSTNPTESIAYFILRSNNEENVRTSMEKAVWATQSQNEPVLNDAFEKFDKVLLFFSVCRSMHFQGLCQMTSRIGHHKSRCLWEAEKHVRGKAKWGGTFTVRWLRIFDLPFDQTNNICNPWNGNRPVKFSRDGQPVPAHVGQQLHHLFDIGVLEFGQGSAILRKPIRIGMTHENHIAVQKLFVNGRFVPAMDFETAHNMILNEEKLQERGGNNNNHSQSHHHHQNNSNLIQQDANDILQRFVSNGNVLDGITVKGLCALLEGENAKFTEKEDKKSGSRRRERERYRNRDRERYRSRSRGRESKRNKRRKRDRRRKKDRDCSSESDNYYSSDSESRKHKTKRKHHRNRTRDRHRGRDTHDKQRQQENVINSLWTQIQLQQALMSQSGLYNALNGNGAAQNNGNHKSSAPAPTYPSNRGGVY